MGDSGASGKRTTLQRRVSLPSLVLTSQTLDNTAPQSQRLNCRKGLDGVRDMAVRADADRLVKVVG